MNIQIEDINGSIAHAFERQADIQADRPALHTSAHSLTYGQVEAAANRIARELLARRGDDSEPIPLIVAEPALMLCAALGVLKAGKFYVPVNPHFPAARLRLIMEDVNGAVALCDQIGRAAANAAELSGERIQIEDLLSGNRAEERPAISVEPDRFAYILYTSGSTGRPKGVVQTHRNVLHNIFRHNALNITPDDRVTLFSADGFVGAVSNPYMALLNGASLASYSFRHDGVHGMIDWLEQKRITIYYSFPSFFRQVVAAVSRPPRNSDLRLFYFGGEQVFPSDVAAARSLFPEATISTGLNSTETGLIRLHMISPQDEIPKNAVPVGETVEGVELKILDEEGREVETGQAGEIAVISPYVFPWYWQSENWREAARELNHHSAEPRVYRSGDRGYINDSGELVHRGRLDSMVKIRGHRVELSEIESSLNAIPEVEEAAVVPYSQTPEDVELAAYVIVKESRRNSKKLRRTLVEMLPEAMIPSSFVFLDTLPRTNNGKVDRRALPAPEPNRPADNAESVAPRNVFEEGIEKIWSKALSAERIGITDNFFELGGHSVMAVRVISAIRKEYGVALPLQIIFETPTIKALAEEISRLRSDQELVKEAGTK